MERERGAPELGARPRLYPQLWAEVRAGGHWDPRSREGGDGR